MFKVYSHNKTDVESDMYELCACKSKEAAEYIISALKFRDTGGRFDESGIYNYYIKEN